MHRIMNVAVLIGSLRQASLSRKLANALIDSTPDTLHASIVEIGTLPLFNDDLEADPPTEWTVFRNQVRAADAMLFVTPEYIRSIPGALKNAIDVGSRPYGSAPLANKPAGVVSQTPGPMGGVGANMAVRQPLMFLNMAVMPQPEGYFANTSSMFDDRGNVISEDARASIRDYMNSFGKWASRIVG